MIERTSKAAAVRIGLILWALFVVVGGGPSGVFAAEITVTSTADGDVDDVGTFLWAINEANTNGDDTNVIKFDFGDASAFNALADPDELNFIRLEYDNFPDGALELMSELTIIGPGTAEGADREFFIVIERTGTEGTDVFIARENLTLRNADLVSQVLVFNGPTDAAAETIDLVYDIDNFNHVVTNRQQEFFFDNPTEEEGRLVKTGLGELNYLSELHPTAGTVKYTGGTILADGVLRTNAFSIPGDIQLCSSEAGFLSADCGNALLVFDISDDASETGREFAGNIIGVEVSSANAKVVKTGAGMVTLTGANDYEGGTYVLEGTLVGDTEAIQGAVHLCPGVADLSTPRTDDADTFACPDAVTEAQLTLDIDSDSTFNGPLHGEGILQKRGNGRLDIDMTQVTFGGSVDIRDGEFALNTALGNGTTNIVDVTVNGGTLSGSGSITGDVVVDSDARIKGTLDIDGDLQLQGTLELGTSTLTGTTGTLANGSTIEFVASTTPASGKLELSGAVTLANGTVEVEFDPDFVAEVIARPPGNPTDRFTVVDAGVAVGAQALTGGPNGDGILFNSAIFDLVLSYDDGGCVATGSGNVCLVTTFDPVVFDDARTRNQRQIARAIDAAFLCAQDPDSAECMIDQDTADDFSEVFASFAINADDIPDVLEQIAGEEYAALVDVRSAAATRYNRSISRRFDLEFPTASTDDAEDTDASSIAHPVGVERMAFAAGAPSRGGYRDYRRSRMSWRRSDPKDPMPMARHSGKGGWTGWLDIHGVMGELGANKNAEEVDYRIYGPLYGMDYGVTENITVGMTVGYTRNEMKTPHSIAKATGNTYQGGVYIGAMFDSFHLAGSVRYAYSDLKTRRSIRFNDQDRTASANVDAQDISGFLEAAYHIPMRQNVLLQPVVSVTFDHLDQDSFKERGLDSLNLEIDSSKIDTVQTSAGVRVALFGRDGDGRYMLPQFRLAYEREWLDPSRAISGNLPSAGENGEFKINGLSLPRDRVLLGLSSEVGVSDHINLFADYDLRVAKDLLEHSLSFGFRAIW